MQRGAFFVLLAVAAAVHAADARALSQAGSTNRAAAALQAPRSAPARPPSGPILTGTMPGTNVLIADNSGRTGRGGVLSNQVQASARAGSTADLRGAVSMTRQAGAASASTRTAIGSNAAQGAVRTAVRTNNAAAGTAAGAGIAAVTANGRGVHISNPTVRTSMAARDTQAAIQTAARGRTSVAGATATGQVTARASQIATSHMPHRGR